ncbi:MAG TPA: NADPH:quinone reductase [Gammaproteobacteria bacterium]|nr:NADPH:quinone reductase [Gammaproteobacteria bacterium]
MKAAWYENIGAAAEVLQVGETSDPNPNAGEVLIEIKASGVNPSDVKTRAGARGELQFPQIIPHSDGSGVITAVGEGIDESRIGERVWIWNGAFGRAHGTCAEMIALPSEQAVSLPDETSYEAAACLGIPASTAYYGMLCDGSVENQTVLVTGGAGAVGYYGIQLAKWSGASVITTVSGDEKAAVANDAGADLIINYRDEDVVAAIKDFTNGEGVNRILEVEFGGNLSVSKEVIKPNGIIASYGSVAVMEPALPFYDLMFKGVKLNTYLIYIVSESDRNMIVNGLNAAMNDQALTHLVSESYALDDIVDAHLSMESNQVIGNIVVGI